MIIQQTDAMKKCREAYQQKLLEVPKSVRKLTPEEAYIKGYSCGFATAEANYYEKSIGIQKFKFKEAEDDNEI